MYTENCQVDRISNQLLAVTQEKNQCERLYKKVRYRIDYTVVTTIVVMMTMMVIFLLLLFKVRFFFFYI